MADEKAPEAEAKKRGKRVMLIPVVVLALGLAAGGYFMTQGGKAEAADAHGATTTTVAHAGQVIRLQPITMNLSDGHVLKVGIALQLVEKPKDKHLAALGGGAHGAKVDPASPMGGLEALALDQAITQLGNTTYEELSSPAGRAKAKKQLIEHIKEKYHGDVTSVYFTDFVMS